MRQHLAVATEPDSEGEILNHKPLRQIVAQHPFSDYAQWWHVGQTFLSFMSEACTGTDLHGCAYRAFAVRFDTGQAQGLR